ncbi:FGGY-family carbohydrate kinase [Amphibacillus sp. Q70]|uniref:FGGY-family carbohydrate kinase n=1 Tax=Amphibacillus sp. Q70 TaxID=3453416 RepID=UPI003F866778
MTKYFLSIDYGGTNTKAMIFDDKGKQCSLSTFLTKKIECKSGFREINLQNLWDSICLAIQDVFEKSGLTGEDIVAVSCVGHGKGLYLLDHDKQIFHNGILSIDERGNNKALEFENKVEAIWDISQQHVVSSQSPVLLNWLKEHEPEAYYQIGYVLSAKDFIRFMLTNEVKQERGDASGNNLLNLETKEYDHRLLEFFCIEDIQHALPELVNCTDISGLVTKQAAKITGLKPGTPVVGGLFDIHACTLGAGVLNNQYFNIIAGTWNINIFPSKESANRKSGLMNSLFPNDLYLLEASSPTSAGNLEIIINMLMDAEKENAQASGQTIYELLEEFLKQTNAAYTKLIFFPFLYGSQIDIKGQGCFMGLTSTTTKSKMIRSVYEGIAFAHRYHIEQLIDELGYSPSAVRISGGAVNSSEWVQIFADIIGLPIETVYGTELGGLGGAIVSSIAVNCYQTLTEAVDKIVKVKGSYQPNLKEHAIYNKKYSTYKNMLSILQPAWEELNEMSEGMELIE